MSGFVRSEADDATEPPRYCTRCGRERTAAGPLCADCGETLIGQGFCTTCDRYWLLPAGVDCPKHELPLDDQRPPVSPLFASNEPARWTTVATFLHPAAAQAPRIRLEAEGIPTFLEGERMGEQLLYPNAAGGVKLQVPLPLVQEARVLLDQSWTAPIESDDDLDDAWDDLAPEPGATRLAIMRGLIVLILMAALAGTVARLLGH